MNSSKNSRTSRTLPMIALLLGTIITTLPRPALAQQDVDPTWFNPWAPSTAIVAPAQVETSHSAQARTRKASTKSNKNAKVRAKRSTTQASRQS